MSVMRVGALVRSLSHGHARLFGKLSEVQPASMTSANPREIHRAAWRHNVVLRGAIDLNERRGIGRRVWLTASAAAAKYG